MLRLCTIALAVGLLFSVAARATATDPPHQTKAEKGFATPQDAFRAWTTAVAAEDWRGLFNCLPPDDRGRALLRVPFLVTCDHMETMEFVASELHCDWRTAEDVVMSDCVAGGIGLLKLVGVNSEMVMDWSVAEPASLEGEILDRLGVWRKITLLYWAVWSDEAARILHRNGVDVRAMEEDILKNPPTEKLRGIGEAYFKFLEHEAKHQAKPQELGDFILDRYFAKVADPAGLYKRLLEWDASGISDADRKLAAEQWAKFSTVRLMNVVVKGDSATGTPVDGVSGKPTGGEPVQFKKVRDRWFVELEL